MVAYPNFKTASPPVDPRHEIRIVAQIRMGMSNGYDMVRLTTQGAKHHLETFRRDKPLLEFLRYGAIPSSAILRFHQLVFGVDSPQVRPTLGFQHPIPHYLHNGI